MQTFWQDAKFGSRVLRQSPTFAIVAVLTLALGVGGSTAIFSIMNAVLLRSFSYPDAGRLVAISAVNLQSRSSPLLASFTKFSQIKEQSKSLEATAAYYSLTMSLATKREAEPIAAAKVSVDFFPLLGAAPARGRPVRRSWAPARSGSTRCRLPFCRRANRQAWP